MTDSATSKIRQAIQDSIGSNGPHQSVQTIELGLDARVEFKPDYGAMHRPSITDVTIMRPLNRVVVEAYIPEEVPSYLVVEMNDGTYRIELKDGKNEYAIRDGEEVSSDE